MHHLSISRRALLRRSSSVVGLLAAGAFAASRSHASESDDLIAFARKEGQVGFYTAMDLQVAQKLAQAFEAAYPGITVRLERSGAERIFQRIAQEQASRINSVDVVCSTNPAHFLSWKRDALLASYVPKDARAALPAEHVDPDGMYASVCGWLVLMGHNTDLVKPADAPKGFLDLLDPRWSGKMVKAHPAYSGGVMTATFLMIKHFGWDYLEKLARQKVLQVQSSVDPPKKILIGERAVMIDGTDYSIANLKEQGRPVDVIYPAEGSPLIVVPSGIFRSAPNPNAAKLFQNFLFSVEAQQLIVDVFGLRSFHRAVREKIGRPALKDIKLLASDPAEVEAQGEQIKERYSRLFGV